MDKQQIDLQIQECTSIIEDQLEVITEIEEQNAVDDPEIQLGRNIIAAATLCRHKWHLLKEKL